jgi:hypothetical protein
MEMLAPMQEENNLREEIRLRLLILMAPNQALLLTLLSDFLALETLTLYRINAIIAIFFEAFSHYVKTMKRRL